MANPENLRGHEFKPGQSGNPKGRPRNKAYDDIKEIFGAKTLNQLKALSTSETKEWDALLLKMTVPQLQAIAKTDTAAAYARATAMAILTDMKNGKTGTIDRLNSRVNGEAARKFELTGKDGAELIPARVLTAKEAAEFIDKLNEDY